MPCFAERPIADNPHFAALPAHHTVGERATMTPLDSVNMGKADPTRLAPVDVVPGGWAAIAARVQPGHFVGKMPPAFVARPAGPRQVGQPGSNGESVPDHAKVVNWTRTHGDPERMPGPMYNGDALNRCGQLFEPSTPGLRWARMPGQPVLASWP